jgi:hypothetical protein
MITGNPNRVRLQMTPHGGHDEDLPVLREDRRSAREFPPALA